VSVQAEVRAAVCWREQGLKAACGDVTFVSKRQICYRTPVTPRPSGNKARPATRHVTAAACPSTSTAAQAVVQRHHR